MKKLIIGLFMLVFVVCLFAQPGPIRPVLTNLTQFVNQTAWRLFYSNTDGDVTELAFGSNGQYLKSNGATSAPTWATPAGTGDILADGSVPFTGTETFDASAIFKNGATAAGYITIYEDSDDGTNYTKIQTVAQAADITYSLPPDDGDNTEVLQTDGSGVLTWVANAGGSTAWDDIVDPDAAATVDFVTYTQTIDIGVTDDGGPKSGLILDVTGLGAGVTDVIALEITTATNDDSDYVPIAVYDDSGADNDLLFELDYLSNMTFALGQSIIVSGDNYISLGDNSDYTKFYFGGTNCDLTWTDGTFNIRNEEDGIDAIVEIEGKDNGEKGILRVLSDGDDKHIELHHDDTNGHIITDTGDIHIEPAGGDVSLAASNLDSSGTIEGATLTEGGVAVINATQGGTWTGVHDYGGADLEIPQASPGVPGVDGGIEVDFTDGKIILQHGSAHAELGASTDVAVGTLIKSWSGTIFEPDGVNDVLTVKAVNSIEFPHGVVITAVYLGIASNTNYVLTVQNFDDFDTINAANGTIDTVTYTADTTGEIIDTTPTYATIAAGQIIMISIPSTDVDWIHFEIYYYEPAA